MKARAAVGIGVLLAGMVLLLARVAWIQIRQHERYRELALQQQIITRSLSARRGNIYDRTGRPDSLLATSVPRWSVFADPTAVHNPRATSLMLSRVLKVDRTELMRKLLRDCQFVWVKRQVRDTHAEYLRRLRLPGVHFRKEYRREYPRGRAAAHVVGFTDVDGRGLTGIELELDRLLTGTPGCEELRCDGRRRGLRGAQDRPARRPADGYDVWLTVDSYVQTIAQQELASAASRHQPECAWAVVLETRTGAVLAMAVWPDFDPNSPAEFDTASRRNRAVTDAYEFGSVLKPLTAAAALEEGLVTADTQFDCHQGQWRIGRRTVHDVHPYGTLTVSEIIARSSNIGVAQLGLLLGPRRFSQYLWRFGFGRPTGVRLPGETSGILRPARCWNQYSLVSVSFGQEFTTTPLSLACAFNVFANDGLLLKPKIVQRVTDPRTGRAVYELKGPEVAGRVVSPRTAAQVMQMLRRVVEEGTGRRAMMDEYPAGGKTGTAQLLRADGRGYSEERYLSSFIGLAPADDPRLLVLVSLKAPSENGYYGGVAAAPACRKIIHRTLRYLKVPARPTAPAFAEAHR